MKRLLAVSLLMFCLSFPASAGHIMPGGYACDCRMAGCIEDYEGECSGHNANRQSTSPPSDGTVEFSIVIVALMLWLRLRA